MYVFVYELRYKEEGDECGAYEVKEEDVEHVGLAQPYEVKQVQSDVEEDEEHLQRRELYGFLPVSEVGERYGLYSVE